MSYRAWPAALVTGAALSAACVVVGEHMVQASDGCLDSTGWFIATPAAWPDNPGASAGKQTAGQDKPTSAASATAAEITGTTDQQNPGRDQIRGCLDLDRIEIAPSPIPDGRA